MKGMTVVIAFAFAACSLAQPTPSPREIKSRYVGPMAPNPNAIGYDPATSTRPKNMPIPDQPKIHAPITIQKPAREPIAIIAPEVPGITIERDAVADGFIVRNGSERTIVALGVGYGRGAKQGYTLVLDGVLTAHRIAPHEAIKTSPNYIEFGGDADEDASTVVDVRLSFAVLDNGEFWGTDQYWTETTEKMRARHHVVTEALKDAGYITRMSACLDDPGCWRDKHKIDGQDRFQRAQALSEIQGLGAVLVDGASALSLYAARVAAFPGQLRRMGKGARSDLQPRSTQDGWYIFNMTGNCGNGSPAYSAGYGAMKDSGCTFPLDYSGNPPASGAGNLNLISPSSSGFSASYTAECARHVAGQIDTIGNALSQGIIALKTRTGDDGVIPYMPRANFFGKIFSNSGQGTTTPYGPDTMFFNNVVGLVEPYNSVNIDPNGATFCDVIWESNSAPYAVSLIDSLEGVYGAVSSTGPSGSKVWNLPYGYVLSNRVITDYCNPDFARTRSFYSAVPRPPVANSSAYTSCTHESGQSAGNECDPYLDWCCCMATYNDIDHCLFVGLIPDSTCGTVSAGRFHEQSIGKVIPDALSTGTFEASASRMGVHRRDSNPAGSWLLDTSGDNTYTDGVTDTYVSSFNPFYPGSIQATDRPVMGDWKGTGHSHIGLYSGGTWYLDANGNGVWDGVAGGDLQYQLGGYTDPNTGVSDVPVVGDWQGSGKDCIGVFRGGTWVLDTNCNGQWDGVYTGGDTFFGFGGVDGDVPVVGKWNGLSQSQVGVVRCYIPSGSSTCASPPFYWVLDYDIAYDQNQYNHGVGLGFSCGYPDPSHTFQCLTPAPFAFGGLSGDQFLAGNWLGDGTWRAAVYRGGVWIQDVDGSGLNLQYYGLGGVAGDTPVVGKW